MKKYLILAIAAAGFFAVGYWTGRPPPSEEANANEPGRKGPVLPVSAQRAAPSGQAAGKTSGEGSVRAFVAGRPFPKGEARAWLLSLIAGTSGDRIGGALAGVESQRVFLTMDADSTREAVASLKELMTQRGSNGVPRQPAGPNGDILTRLLGLSMMRTAEFDPDAAFAMLRETPDLNDGETMLGVFGRFALQDIARAEQLALTLPDRQRGTALMAVLGVVANKDPAAALDFADKYPKILDRRERQRFLEQWARRDPLPAMTAAVKEMVKSGETELLRQPFDEWYKQDANAAAQWAESHDGPGKVTAQALLLEKRAGDEPASLLPDFAALLQSAPDQRELYRLATAIADSLANNDLPAAREWASNLPTGELRDGALHQVAEQFVKDDAPAASEWIKSMPPGKAKDGAARELVSAIKRRDPAGAFEWARNIQDENLRSSSLGDVLGAWRELDPDAANAAAQSLPPALRETLK